jgi:hypothetical protein
LFHQGQHVVLVALLDLGQALVLLDLFDVVQGELVVVDGALDCDLEAGREGVVGQFGVGHHFGLVGFERDLNGFEEAAVGVVFVLYFGADHVDHVVVLYDLGRVSLGGHATK